MTQLPEFRTYHPADVVAFRKTGEEFGGLSNMAPGFPVHVAGLRLRTSEALYQACRFPHLPNVQRIIIEETSPMTAKMRSKPFRQDSREHWDDVRVPIMRWCLRVKLAQNWMTFGSLLEKTGDRAIVEDSRKDDFWGAMRNSDGDLHGMNVLGRLLMELRGKLRDCPDTLKRVEPLKLSDFVLLGKDIGTIEAEASTATASLQRPEKRSEPLQLWANR